jgi:hypothetical protein
MMALPWTLGPISDSLHSVRPATDFKTESLLLKHSFFRQKNTAKYLFADSIDFSRLFSASSENGGEPWRALYSWTLVELQPMLTNSN